ncbi:MFS transporter [Vibrio sp. S4M6]|uniref:MFS transporter n=1 Tax=Vibrio sinus TaxID=2946865 RepID=UPI002029FED9|nr:MFS transporter [Vibrio sinus]MCL9782107.1 MFS transporter [Vibrio sinus]
MSSLNKPSEFLILCSVLLAVFVVPSSISGTAIALPYISESIKTDMSTLQWVVNAFNLTFASFTLVWGKLSDLLGKKKAFLYGAFIYALASLLSMVAKNVLLLDFARAMAGIGGAAIFSCGSAIFIHFFDGDKRTKAFAFFGTTAGLGITLGPTLSGLLIDIWGWHSIFGLHALSLILVLVIGLRIPKDTVEKNNSNIDLIGGILFISGMFFVILTLSKGYDWGWNNNYTITSVSISLFLLIAFLIRIKTTPNPIISLELVRNRKFLGFILVPVVASFTFVALLTYLPTYFTAAKQLSASSAGMMMLFLTSPVLVFPLVAGKLASKGVSTKKLIYCSVLSMLAGSIILIMSIYFRSDVVLLLPLSLILIGVGMGMSAGLIDGEALSCVQASEVGMAAGLLNTFRLGSEAIAVAAYGSLLSSTLSRLIPSHIQTFGLHNIEEWITSVASGNFFEMVSSTSGIDKSLLTNTLVDLYTTAFTITNGVLILVSLIVTLTIFSLLKEQRRVEQYVEQGKIKT